MIRSTIELHKMAYLLRDCTILQVGQETTDFAWIMITWSYEIKSGSTFNFDKITMTGFAKSGLITQDKKFFAQT